MFIIFLYTTPLYKDIEILLYDTYGVMVSDMFSYEMIFGKNYLVWSL